jgi:uncharacterized coiled-coil protein SlyX
MTAKDHKESNAMLENDLDIEIRKPAFPARLGRAFMKLLRFVLILAILAGVVAAFYYGVPYFYQKVILPIEDNTARLSDIEKAQSTDVEQLTDQITDLQSRLSALETRQTSNAQAITELTGQVSSLEKAVATHTESLKQLEIMQTQLEGLTSGLEGQSALVAELKTNIIISRSIEMLSRARLYLSQSNFGMAKQDVVAARDLLISLQAESLGEESNTLMSVLTQLNRAVENLPNFPVVAVDDVDIAWQLLINILPDQTQEVPATNVTVPTPNPTVESQATTTP